jgi:4-carboxymuconolactone decarboxylase
MARVPLIDEDQSELAALIEKIRGARGGRLINIYRLMLHSPALAEAWFNLNQAARYATEIDGRCRELVIMRVAILNRCEYVLKTHTAQYALKEGLTREQVEQLGDWNPSKLFDAKQRALLAYSDAMTRDLDVADAVFAEVRKHFTERQTVELTMLVGAYNMLTRVLNALKIDPE